MLIIGHRGAAGLGSENTLKSLNMAFKAGVDILEFDVHLTKDGKAVLLPEKTLEQTHHLHTSVRSFTLAQLEKASEDSTPITLESVLNRYFGKVLINIELKSNGSGVAVTQVLQTYAKGKSSLWDNVLVSSFKPAELIAARKLSKQVNLALLHDLNSFAYIKYHRSINLTAVGFHRLHINKLALEIAKKAGIFTYAYTVDRPEAARRLEQLGIDGIVTNRPDILLRELPHN